MVIKLSLDECNQRIKRRSSLKALIDEHYPDKKGSLLICAGIEKTRENFYQDSTFFYFVGIEEPGVIFYQNSDGESVLYEPEFGTSRDIWMVKTYDSSYLEHLGIGERLPLGDKIYFYPKQCDTLLKNNIDSSNNTFLKKINRFLFFFK